MRRFVGAEVDAAMSGPETAVEIDERQIRVTLLDADNHDREISEDELDASSISDQRWSGSICRSLRAREITRGIERSLSGSACRPR